jgi:hypothetical protein
LCFYYDNDDQPLFLTFGGSIINLIFENWIIIYIFIY